MFRNWINLAEPLHLVQRLRRDPLLQKRIARKLRLTSKGRVLSTWSQTESLPVHAWDIPAVQTRWNKMMTGDPTKSYHRYVADKYLADHDSLRALSLGCGAGLKELQWAETGRFASIDAYDVSENRINAAVAAAKQSACAGVLRYHVGDAHTLRFARGSFDVVIFDHSLHHFSSLETLLPRMSDALKPGGLVVANEFIGPSRFQWTERQLKAVNELLGSFPLTYKTLWQSEHARANAWQPSKLLMWISDPSEAVESSKIIPLLTGNFDVMEQRGYGGAIVHLLFAGIAHHFIAPDAEGERLLQLVFSTEDRLLAENEIDHDFALIIARKKP